MACIHTTVSGMRTIFNCDVLIVPILRIVNHHDTFSTKSEAHDVAMFHSTNWKEHHDTSLYEQYTSVYAKYTSLYA